MNNLPDRLFYSAGSNVTKRSAALQLAAAIPLTLMLVTLWALTHRFQAFARDGELYAVQALARIHPELGSDLYLQNTSQDQYSIFSPLLAQAIRLLGLQNAELLLFLVCTVWFLAAGWLLCRALADADTAWLSVALLIITVGYYGSYQIFSYSENYLTARSLAEAMVVTSMAYHFRGQRVFALLVAAGAMFIHPLMALPGLLVLICLSLPIWLATATVMSGIVLTLGLAMAASPSSAVHWLRVMDSLWLDTVRERSQFLFLSYWTPLDWEMNARPFVSLTLAALVTPDERIRKFCCIAMLVGAAGLAVALIAGDVGPVAILLQGQAWRWVWITCFTGILLIAPTVQRVWRDDACGPLCAVLYLLGWTSIPGIDSLACGEAALILWLVRSRINVEWARYLGWAAAGAGVLALAAVAAELWTVSSRAMPGGLDARVRDAFGFGISDLLLVGILGYCIGRCRSMLGLAIATAALLAGTILILPGSLKQSSPVGTDADIEEFMEWRDKIPPSSSVLMVPTRKSASFVWFTLGRTSYLSLGQSAGVVFSRETALEVRRRSEVLLPITAPDWKILSGMQARHARPQTAVPATHALTAASLAGICRDPQLGFVMTAEDVGLAPIARMRSGAWKDWSLYDCRSVRLN